MLLHPKYNAGDKVNLTIRINTKEKIFLKYLFISGIVASFNVIFLFNRNVSILLILFELFILLYLLLKNHLPHFLSLYVIFISNCIELSIFAGDELFYNIKNVRFLGINLGIWILFPAIINAFIRHIDYSELKKKQFKFFFFAKFFLLINLIAALTGLVLILINDNNINHIGDIIPIFIGSVYAMLFLPLAMIILMSIIFMFFPNKLHYISLSLEAALWGTVIQTIVSYFGGIYGYYGGLPTLMQTNLSFIMPLMLLLSLDKSGDIAFPKINLFLAIVGNVLTCFYNANGKIIILLGIVFIIFSFSLMKYGTPIFKVFLMSLFFGFATLITIGLNYLVENNLLFQIKFEQAKGLLNIFDVNWLINMPGSPKVRVAEIINIGIEFINKPWLIITGKGYVGSIKDYVQMFTSYEGSFSFEEWSAGVFYNLHEIATQLLMFGCLGIWYSIRLIKETVKSYQQNIWLLFGCCWFLLLYGYSFTISCFCSIALFYGLKNVKVK